MDSSDSPVSPPAASTTSSSDEQKHYFCQRCLNHRLEFPRKGHKPYCRFAACRCDDCAMVERRRLLNNQLSRRRPLAEKPPAGARKVRDPKCARCSAHGEETALRGHKRASCPFNDCDCNLVSSPASCVVQSPSCSANWWRTAGR